VLLEPIVGQWDRGLVPRLPLSGLVSGNQEDRFTRRVEREDQPNLAGFRRSGPQLLHVVVSAALEAVHQGSAQGRTLLGEQVDRLADQVCGDRVVAADLQEPGFDGGVDTAPTQYKPGLCQVPASAGYVDASR
jgi:hypothetical protein